MYIAYTEKLHEINGLALLGGYKTAHITLTKAPQTYPAKTYTGDTQEHQCPTWAPVKIPPLK